LRIEMDCQVIVSEFVSTPYFVPLHPRPNLRSSFICQFQFPPDTCALVRLCLSRSSVRSRRHQFRRISKRPSKSVLISAEVRNARHSSFKHMETVDVGWSQSCRLSRLKTPYYYSKTTIKRSILMKLLPGAEGNCCISRLGTQSGIAVAQQGT
jgi:hypothetical protein